MKIENVEGRCIEQVRKLAWTITNLQNTMSLSNFESEIRALNDQLDDPIFKITAPTAVVVAKGEINNFGFTDKIERDLGISIEGPGGYKKTLVTINVIIGMDRVISDPGMLLTHLNRILYDGRTGEKSN